VRKLLASNCALFALYHGSTSSTFRCTPRSARQGALFSQVLGTKSENTSIGGLVVKDRTANIQKKQWRDRQKTPCVARCTRTDCNCTVSCNHACALPPHFNNYYHCKCCQLGTEEPLALHSAVLTLSAGIPCIMNSTPTLYNYNFTDYPRHECGQGQCSCIATAYGLDVSGIEFRWGRDFLHPASCAMGSGPL
jgi:hypothetical protein